MLNRKQEWVIGIAFIFWFLVCTFLFLIFSGKGNLNPTAFILGTLKLGAFLLVIVLVLCWLLRDKADKQRMSRIKHIIAREGLIILSLLILGILSGTLHLRCLDRQRGYVYEFSTQGHKYLIAFESKYSSEIPQEDKLDVLKTINKENPGLIKNPIIVPDDLQISYKGREKMFRSILSGIGYFWLLIALAAYPIYLIIRFFIWATKTLKSQTEGDK